LVDGRLLVKDYFFLHLPALSFSFKETTSVLAVRKKEGTSIHQPNGRKKDTAGEYKAGP
jgi:hypothetical protein